MIPNKRIANYLIRHSLLSEEDVLHKGILIQDMSKRNRNTKIVDYSDRGYFIKQGNENTGIGTLSYEINVYKYLNQTSNYEELQAYLPQVAHYDTEHSVLVLQYIANSENLFHFHVNNKFPLNNIQIKTGHALGLLHRSPHNLNKMKQESRLLTHYKPGFGDLSAPPINVYRQLSRTSIEVLKIMREFPVVFERLDQLIKKWEINALIHYDVKLSNFILYADEQHREKNKLKLLDWEYAGFGDYRWDLGSFFCGYLDLWVSSMPISGNHTADEFMHHAKCPLNIIQSMINQFWKSYCTTAGINTEQQKNILQIATMYAGARLLHTAFERAMTAVELDNRIVTLLQLGHNILCEPEDAIVQLLGIEGS